MDKKAENGSPEMGDYFYSMPERRTGMSRFAGVAVSGMQCRSRCIQEGKTCPLYKTCTQKYELREILP